METVRHCSAYLLFQIYTAFLVACQSTKRIEEDVCAAWKNKELQDVVIEQSRISPVNDDKIRKQ